MNKVPKDFTLDPQASLGKATVAGTPMINALALKQDPGELEDSLKKHILAQRGDVYHRHGHWSLPGKNP